MHITYFSFYPAILISCILELFQTQTANFEVEMRRTLLLLSDNFLFEQMLSSDNIAP